MKGLILAASAIENWILPIILLVLVVVLFVTYYLRNKKYQQNADMMTNNLKKGDKVKTYSGVYGKIVEIVEAEDGSKVCTIETGTEKNKSYVSYDIRAVYAINEQKPVEAKKEEVKEEKTENVVEVSEEPKTEEVAEPVEEKVETPAKKTRKKKSE